MRQADGFWHVQTPADRYLHERYQYDMIFKNWWENMNNHIADYLDVILSQTLCLNPFFRINHLSFQLIDRRGIAEFI